MLNVPLNTFHGQRKNKKTFFRGEVERTALRESGIPCQTDIYVRKLNCEMPQPEYSDLFLKTGLYIIISATKTLRYETNGLEKTFETTIDLTSSLLCIDNCWIMKLRTWRGVLYHYVMMVNIFLELVVIQSDEQSLRLSAVKTCLIQFFCFVFVLLLSLHRHSFLNVFNFARACQLICQVAMQR